MSALLQVAARIASFPTVDGAAAPALVSSGVPYDPGGLAVDLTSPIAYWHQGIPFTAAGRLAVSQVPPVRYGAGAAGFDVEGRLCMGVLTPDYYSSGVPYAVASNMAVTGLAPFLGVTILTHPVDVAVVEPNPAIFSVTASSGDASPINYQWQVWSGGWVNLSDGGSISGATTAVLTIDPTAFGNATYRCLCSNAQPGTTPSGSATLTVDTLESFDVLTFDGLSNVRTFDNGNNVLTFDGVP